MANMSTSRLLLVIGLVIVVVDLVLSMIGLAPPLLLLAGLGLCVASAAVFASTAPDEANVASARRRARRQLAVVVSVLAVVTLTPFVVVGTLWLVGIDPLSLFLGALALFATSGVLVLVFVVVYVVGRSRSRRAAEVLSGGR